MVRKLSAVQFHILAQYLVLLVQLAMYLKFWTAYQRLTLIRKKVEFLNSYGLKIRN